MVDDDTPANWQGKTPEAKISRYC